MESAPARLLSRSCTTGWLDWVWGELWETPEGLMRFSLGWIGTYRSTSSRQRRGGVSTVDPSAAVASSEDVRARHRPRRSDRWIPLADIRRAHLRRGRMTSRLSVVFDNGSRAKLLWLKHDPAYERLSELLSDLLGDQLVLR
jgi:hypothetical protein